MTRRSFDAVEHARSVKPSAPSEPDLWTGIAWPAPSNPTPSSEAAADALTHTKAGRQRREQRLQQILALIASRESGYTIDELDAETQLGTGTICPRIDELRTAGLIDTSKETTRPTRRGKAAAVHFVTARGRAVLAQERAA